jgi:hypothetical protein
MAYHLGRSPGNLFQLAAPDEKSNSAKRRIEMTKSKSKQPEDQQITSEQSESPETPKAPTKASSRRLPKGFVLDNSPSLQIFIGGLPGKPPKK